MKLDHCPYCKGQIEIKIAGFAPSTHRETCIHCKKEYRIVDFPKKGPSLVTLEEFEKKYKPEA